MILTQKSMPVITNILFVFYKMKIATTTALTERLLALEPDFRHQSRKSDIVVSAKYGAKLGATLLIANVFIQTTGKIEMYLASVATYPFGSPAFSGKFLFHNRLDKRSVKKICTRHFCKLWLLGFLTSADLAVSCFTSSIAAPSAYPLLRRAL